MKKILGLVIGMGISSWGYAVNNPNIMGTKSYTETSGTLTYVIDYKNIGGTATNVLIYDQIPEGTEYILTTAGTGTLPATITYSKQYPYDWKNNENDAKPITYILWEIGTITPTKLGSVTFAVKRRDEK